VISPTTRLKVCGFGHGERRRKARKKVTVVLAIDHTLRAHEALGCPYALPGLLEVVHRFFEDGVFVGHDQSIRAGILRSLDAFVWSLSENPYMFRDAQIAASGDFALR
jgi:hypothetical protein